MPAARPDLFKLISGEAHVALAVSGGSDSMALLELAQERCKLPKLSVLTVDHGLRSESAAEASFVCSRAMALGLEHHTLAWTGAKPSTGLQAKARQARYDLMAEWCKAHGATELLTAHTLDDQAETVLMRLARTTSIDSLAGIYPVSEWNGIRLFRPLLDLRRSALRDYLKSQGQEWLEDPSNTDERFERVRVRKALPVLDELGITPESLASLAKRARDVSDALWSATDDWVRQHAEEHETGYCTLPTAAYDDLSPVLQTRILGWLISHYGGGKTPEPAELELLAGWLASGGGRRTLGGAIIARRQRTLLIGREPGRIDPAPVAVPQSGRLVWDQRFEVKAEPGSLVAPAFLAARTPRRKDIPAFVQAALPAILAQAADDHGFEARFLPRLKS